MQVVIDIPDEWKERIEYNRRPNTIECGQLVESIWRGKILSKAKWIEKEVRGSKCLCCSNCGEGSGTLYEYNFCPWCGALMEVSK